jgi:hypothetical protein
MAVDGPSLARFDGTEPFPPVLPTKSTLWHTIYHYHKSHNALSFHTIPYRVLFLWAANELDFTRVN